MARELKPLSKRARAEVLKVASTHPDLQPLLGDERARLLVEPNFTDRRSPKDEEQAVVAAYDYERGRSVVAVVDRAGKRVLSVETTPLQFQLSEAEQREAERLAAQDERVRRFLRGREMDPLTRLYFPPPAVGLAPEHRYAIVFLRPSATARRYAVVDLTERRVADVLGPRDLTET